ncbi:Hypothetical protein D9617_2g059900 [Elsinoe fawcettii]|nr:Hypothetical protein D9617_2g059900 [Elsinoe fawcettii]
MPRPPGLITQEFISVDGDGKSPQVICRHCQTARIAKSSGKRKVNHLRRCQAFLAKHSDNDEIMQILREELPDEELRPRGRPKNPVPTAPLPPKTKLAAEPYWFPHEGLVRPDATALLLVDMQQDFVSVGGFLDQLGHPISTARTLIPPLQKLLHAFRCAQFPIYHARHSHRHDLSTFTGLDRARIQPSTINARTGHPLPTFTAQDLVPGTPGPLGHFLLRQSPGTDPVRELAPLYSELMFDHPRSSVFTYTDFDLVIRNRSIKNLIIAGLSVNASIRDTVRDATDRGFDVCIVEGCVAAQALSKHAAEANKEGHQRQSSMSQTPAVAPVQPTPNSAPAPPAQMQAPATQAPAPQDPSTAPQTTPQPPPSVQSQVTPAPENGPITDLSEVDAAARKAIDDVMPKDTRHGLGFGTIAKFEDLFTIVKTLAKVRVAFPGTPSQPCFPDQPIIPLPAPAPPPPPPQPAYTQPPQPTPSVQPQPYPYHQYPPQQRPQYASPYAGPPPQWQQPYPQQPFTPYHPHQQPPLPAPQPSSAPAAPHSAAPPPNGTPAGSSTTPVAGIKRAAGPVTSEPPKKRRGRGIQWPIFYQGPPPKAARPQNPNGNVIASVANRAPRGSQMHNPPPGGPLQVIGQIGEDGHVHDEKGATGYAVASADDEFRREMMAHAGHVDGEEEEGDDEDDEDDEENVDGTLAADVDVLDGGDDEEDEDEEEDAANGNGEIMQYA